MQRFIGGCQSKMLLSDVIGEDFLHNVAEYDAE